MTQQEIRWNVRAIALARALAIVGIASLAACASSDEALQRATARETHGDPDTVTISNVDRGLMNVRWDATVGRKHYRCSADDMVRQPYCSPRL